MSKQAKKQSTTSSQQKQKSQQAQDEILLNKIETQQNSALYVKRLIALGISNVTYLRGLFNEECYVDRYFDDFPIKIFKHKNGGPLENIQNWLVGAFDAIDKRYLKSIIFAIFEDPEKPDTVLETYQFNVVYTDKDATVTLSVNDSKAVTLKAKVNSLRMLRALLIATNTLENLPNEAYVTMKLYYYDDVTPKDYEPPNFCPAKKSNFEYEKNKVVIEIGHLSSHWHEMNFVMNASLKMVKDVENADYIGIQAVETTSNSRKGESRMSISDTSSDSAIQDNMDLQHANNEVNDHIPKFNNFNEDTDEGIEEETPKEKLDSSKSSKRSKAEEKKKINCPCLLNDEKSVLIQCDNCKSWQHAICFKIFDEVDQSKLSHRCLDCGTKQNNKSLSMDKSFLNLTETESKELCLIRRCLYDFLKSTQLNKTELTKKYTTHSGLIIKRLTSEGFIKCSNANKHDYKIQNVERALELYFKTDKYKITDTPLDQAVPLELNEELDSGFPMHTPPAPLAPFIVQDPNTSLLNQSKHERASVLNQSSVKQHHSTSLTLINQSKLSTVKEKRSGVKNKCSDPIDELSLTKSKRQKKVSETIQPTSVSKSRRH